MSDIVRKRETGESGNAGEFGTKTFTEADEEMATPMWIPGMIHPTGGYDEVIIDDETGATTYLLDGDKHREDGPAVEHIDGTCEYFFEGVHHRDGDRPSVEYSTGEREYHQHGILHRDGDQPAMTFPDGEAEYWQRGLRHRDGDKPAVVRVNGQTEYWVEGKRHRDPASGPALIRADGTDAYFEHGHEIHPNRRQD